MLPLSECCTWCARAASSSRIMLNNLDKNSLLCGIALGLFEQLLLRFWKDTSQLAHRRASLIEERGNPRVAAVVCASSCVLDKNNLLCGNALGLFEQFLLRLWKDTSQHARRRASLIEEQGNPRVAFVVCVNSCVFWVEHSLLLGAHGGPVSPSRKAFGSVLVLPLHLVPLSTPRPLWSLMDFQSDRFLIHTPMRRY